ncbi:SwmB domain-containing protein [Verminephrobacter aporrectodeae]|uniref:SwmB domain-containing protein n=1 Tax=Verminephrobacter aporrectodeae TaxID=1110389 RepID=UPI002238B3DA|nr:SwmB domain-containing protein [Verminephrobacter aporrectodeae]MCW5219821.1 hypothetical protein [Verminephrobacter aporrectodeae subsp. tuberculatae]
MSIDSHATPGLRAGETTNTGGTQRPTLAATNPITIGNNKLGIGASTTVTIRFAEAIATNSFSTSDLSVGGYAKLTNLQSTDGGTTWTVTLTAPGWADFPFGYSLNHNSTGNQIRVNLAGVTNPTGNAGVGQVVSTVTYDIDTLEPSAVVTLGDSALTAGETTTVTISFSEPVTGFTANNIDLSRTQGTLGPLTALGDGRTWTATFTPTVNINAATNSIGVNFNGVTDLAGNTSGTSFNSNYSIDTRPGSTGQTSGLSARVTLTDDRLTTGEKATVIIAFNKPVNGFTLDDVDATHANGTLSDLVCSADGRTWTATFTPTAGVIAESNTIRVNLAGVTDAAGTAGTGSATSDSFIVNTAPIAATITLTDTALTTGETTTVTFTFNQVVLGFTMDDVVLDTNTGTLGALRTTGNQIWIATFTPKANVSDATNTISVNLAGVANMAGRSGTGTAISANYTVNTEGQPTTTNRPTLAATNPITIGDDKLIMGESTTVTIRFAEAIATDSFRIADLSVSGYATLSNLRSTDGGTTWTVTLTAPTEQEIYANGNYDIGKYNSTGNQIRVNLAGVTNPAGTAGVGQAVSTVTYDIDTFAPSATITLGDSALTAGETTTVTISFSEPVNGFDASDIDLTQAHGTLGPLTALADGRTWTATFTPTANINAASNRIRVNLGGVTDLAGNRPNTASPGSSNYSIDTRPGTTGQTADLSARVTLTDDRLTTGEKATVIIAFNKPVTRFSFTIDDMDATRASGTLSEPILSADGRTWTATFTPTANVNAATNTISVNLAGVTDAAGTPGTGSVTSANFRVDTALPNATITLSDTALTTGETTTVTFSFNQTVMGFTIDDVDLTQANGTLSALVYTPDSDSKIWTATFTPNTNVNVATNTIHVNLTGVANLAGRSSTGTASSANYTVNTGQSTATNRPTLAATNPITIGDDKLSIGESTTVTIRFAEAIATHSFSIADLSVSGYAALSNLRSTDGGTTWTVTLTAPTEQEIYANGNYDIGKYNSTGNQIRVNLAGVTNPAGTAGVGQAVSTVTYDIDTFAPSATITLGDSALTAGETTTVTISFSEPVNGFDASDIDLTQAHGTLGPLTALADGRTWTATFTPTANINAASNRIRVNLGGVTDLAGNRPNTASPGSSNYSIDTRPGTTGQTADLSARVTLTDDRLTTGEKATVIIAFNKPVTRFSFTIDDMDATRASGTLSEPILSADGRTWTATFTPTANVNAATNTISVNLAGVTDAAGTPGTGSVTSANFRVDTALPNATITLSDTALTTGETTTVTFRFNQTVMGFTIDDVDLTQANGTLSALEYTPESDSKIWTATFTPNTNVNVATNTIRVNLAGVANLAGRSGTGTASSANYTVGWPPDTTPPVFSSATVNGDRLVLTFSEPLDGSSAPPATGSFPVSVEGDQLNSYWVRAVAVNGPAGTITLTLTKAVTPGQVVRIGYQAPGGPPNQPWGVIQDVAGNDAATFVRQTVTNNTPAPAADTTPPVFSSATINGNQLVLTYTEAGTLDPAALSGNAGFTVTSSIGTAITVQSAVVNATAKTVTLTLSILVTRMDIVNVRYTKPASGAVVQDAAGNAAASFGDRFVTNDTPADTTAPQLITIGNAGPGDYLAPTVNDQGDELELVFDDASRLDARLDRTPAATDFTVLVDGVARAVSRVTVPENTKTIRLTLATPVTHRQHVSIAYQDSTPNDARAIQDAAGNRLDSFQTTGVVNTALDKTAPQLITTGATRPTVNDKQLVLRFSDTSELNADPARKPAAGDFAVRVAGVANAVTAVTVNGADKTITLTLSTAVTPGQTTTVAYADSTPNDTSGIQDARDNRLASFAATQVNTDTTPPVIHSATVNGDELVLTYTEAGTLDASALTGNAGYAVSSSTGTAITVSSAVVNGTAKTVTLTLSRAVTRVETVSVSYTKPESGAVVQDAEGNDAANFSSREVTNNTPREPNRGLNATIRITDRALTAGESTTVSFTFTEPVNGFDASDITCTNGTLSTPTANAARTVWTATFTPTANVNAPVNVINVDLAKVSDNAGNPGVGSVSSANYSVATRDTVAPVISSAAVTGDQLVLTYIEANTLDPAALTGNAGFTVSSTAGTAITVRSAVVDATAKTVTLTLSRAVTSVETVTVNYAKPATGGVQDVAGNAAANLIDQAVTNNTPAPADTTPPVISTATVIGDQLVLTYIEAGTLNGATLAGNAGFTVSSTTGTAIAVSSAVVNGAAKTVTLTLSRAVTSVETVTVNYAKPATGGVQDVAGNAAANLIDQAVTNNTPAPADTTPPVISTATVIGDQLVLTYTEAGTLNAAVLTGNAGFTVSSTTGTTITVSSAVVNGAAKTVTLTLSRAVTRAETVTVNYAKPAAGGVQDAAGNAAANLIDQAVTNNTPAPADTTPPVISTATVIGDQLVLTYIEANTLNGATLTGNAGFTVSSTTGTAITVSSAVVNGAAKTVTLTLSRAVTSVETVTVNYAKPATGGVQDAAGNAAANLIDQAVTNNTPAPADTTPPVISTATVIDDQLVLTYIEANSLNGATLTGNAGFTVSSTTGTAITVRSAVVNATLKTVTLTLSRAVANAEVLSVSYAKPATGNGVQDAAGNAAENFSDQAISNNTPDTTAPVIHTATVTGDELVLTYTEANTLDAAALTGNAGFTVSSSTGTAITVSSAVVNGAAKTVTLTLSRAVTQAETVNLSYSKPTSGAVVQDAAGNDAANFSSREVTNNTPREPLGVRITIADRALTAGETTTVTFFFTKPVNGFDTSDILSPNGTLSTPTANAERTAWTATFTPTANVSAEANAIRVDLAGVTDNAGNAGVGGVSSANYSVDTRDTVAPVINTATVTGDQLVLTYTEANTLDPAALTGNAGFAVSSSTGAAITVHSAVVSAVDKTVTLTLSRAVTSVETVSVSYTKPATGAVVQDAAGNDAVDFSSRAVTNTTPAPTDTTPPAFHSAAVTGDRLVLAYTEANTLDPAALAGNAGFTVSSSTGTAITVRSAVVNATDKTVTLTLSRAVTSAETVTVSYTKPTSGAVVQDAAGNDAADFSAKPVANNTPAPSDTTAPEFSSAAVNGSQLVLTYTETNTLDPAALAGNAGFAVSSSTGTAITVRSAVVNATDKTVTLTLSRAVTSAETVTVSYTKPATGAVVQDAAGNDAVDFSAKPVANNTPGPSDTTAPEFSSAAVNGSQLVLTYTEANTLDPAALAGNAGFAVSSSTGTAITVRSAVVNAVDKTVTLTLSRAVANGETVTVSYTKPTSGAVVQDAAGNDAADFSAKPVANNTPSPSDTTAPEFSSAAVNGSQLVLTYTEANTLDPAALTGNAGFAVSSSTGTAITVRSAVVSATAKTVTLTLSRAVANGETVTVSYTKPTSGAVVQDATGNDAADFSAKPVANNTPSPSDTTAPEFSSAAVNGSQLVLTYTEANTLDPAVLTGNAGFTVNTAAGAVAITVNSAVVNAAAKTVTLTLSRAVTSAETVTVSYTKPTSGAVVQDAAGNDAVDFSSREVTNNTPRDPLSVRITIADRALTADETTTVTFFFTKPVNGFDTSDILSPNGTLSTPTANAERTIWTATFTPTANVSAEANAIRVDLAGVTDTAGNAGVGSVSSANYSVDTRDTVAPVISTATVTGDQLVLTYTEAGTLNAAALTGNAGFTVSSSTGTAITVNSARVNGAKTITLTLSRAAANGETLSVSYAKPATGNGVQDAAGNNAVDFSNQAITNNTPDTTPPVIRTATVNGDQLVLTYTEANTLNGAALTGNAGFTVSSSTGTAIAVNSARVNGADKTVTLTLSRAAANGEKLTLSYTKPATGGNAIQDAAGNAAADLHNQPVGNVTPAPAPAPAPAAPAPAPAPAPEPAPKTNPDAPNADHDGVPDAQENQAIGPKGSAIGDGNGDRIQDSTQAAVASFSAKTSSGSDTSVTLVADSQDGMTASGSNTRITSLEQRAAPSQTPRALETPIALTSFKATLETAGSTKAFSLYVDPKIGVNGYWLQDHGGTWVNLASSPYGGKMVMEGGRLRLDFSIQDGGPFDADGQANGVITTFGAAAQMQLSIAGQASDVAHGEFWI